MDKRAATLLAIALMVAAVLYHQAAPSSTDVEVSVTVLPGTQLHGLTAPLILIQGQVDPENV